MPHVRCSTDLAISDGPRLRNTSDLELEAYDRITVTVPPAAGGPPSVKVEVQPGTFRPTAYPTSA